MAFFERQEDMVIGVECRAMDKDLAQVVRKVFKCKARAGDAFSFTYKFFIKYDDVVKQLETMETLLDTGKVESINSTALNQQRCLIQDLLLKIERIEQKMRVAP